MNPRNDFFFHSHIPAAKNRSSKGLIIVMHGKGDSARPFRWIQKELDLIDYDFLLLQARKSYLDGYSWYGEPPNWDTSILRVRQKIFQLLDELTVELGYPSNKIFLLGFSQGCLVATDVALNYPRRLGGVVGVSGYFYFPPRWRAKIQGPGLRTPWLLTHGHRDDVLPLSETKFGMLKLKKLGLPVTWVESDKAHTFSEEEYPIIRQWVLDSRKRSVRLEQGQVKSR